jgi:glucoamylase
MKKASACSSATSHRAITIAIPALFALASLSSASSLAQSSGISLGTPNRVSQTKGVPHHWADAAKESVGTSYGRDTSRVWFTTTHGILSEVYYPRIDRTQIGDMQLLFSNLGDGQPSFLEEKRDFTLKYQDTEFIPRAKVEGVYSRNGVNIRFVKEVVVDPSSPVLRVKYSFSELPAGMKIHVLHKPAADGDGEGDVGRMALTNEGPVLVAWDAGTRNQTYQVVTTNAVVESTSVGSVGVDDGWQQLNRYGRIVYESDAVGPSNIALTTTVAAQKDLDIFVGFGASLDEAYGAVQASRGREFSQVKRSYDSGWKGYYAALEQASPWMANLSQDVRNDTFWNTAIVKVHEDKLNPGAIVASSGVPDLPRGTGAGDGKDVGGYHLVWPRDLYKSAKGLMRVGDLDTAYAALRFMARQELPDGRIAQNTWVDGRPYWVAQQMDQEAYPLILAAQLRQRGVTIDASTQAFLDRRMAIVENSNGYTTQERWEEEGGFSPNTIAVLAAAMKLNGKPEKAAKFLRIALEKSVTRNGPLSSKPYFIRTAQRGLPDAGDWININNGGPWLPEARAIDGGFLEFYRWFPDLAAEFDALGVEMLSVLENTSSVYRNPDTGVALSVRGLPLFRRYNSDAYGLAGVGGPWPILTSESFLPRMAQDNSVSLEAFRTVKALWTETKMCPEQLLVENQTFKAMPFAASPLVWCHADMIELAYRGAQR